MFERLFPVRAFLACVLTLSSAITTTAQDGESTSLEILVGERLRISERTNLSLREDGHYIGLMNRQVDAYLSRDEHMANAAQSAVPFVGRVLSYAQTRRDLRQIGRPIDASYETVIRLDSVAGFTGDSRFPSYLNIPSLPTGPISPSHTWTAPARLIIDLPDGRGAVTLEIVVSYRYDGMETFAGERVHRITAGFATRYPYIVGPDEEPPAPLARDDIARITGRHDLTILIPITDRAPLFIRDEITEQYEYSDKPSGEVRGHVLLFVYAVAADNRSRLATRVEAELEAAQASGIDVEETNEGARLTVRDIRFVPDQAVILPEERPRLESIAAALAGLTNVRFLVVGHTADVGTKESQLTLSMQRAEVIARELANRGIAGALIDIEGRGGTEPIGDNTTDEGRARNRRVEIYLLEQ